MTNRIGQCGLCLEPGELRESHLLPAGIWKLSREPLRAVDPNPVVITKTAALATSRQVSAYFLCDRCEDKFSKNGESYVLSECQRPNGHFGLRKKLENSSPIVKQPGYELFDVGSLLGEKIEKYLYFAGSVFWRASARSWIFGGERVAATVALGHKYQEELRLYLFGQLPFPLNARVFIHVSSEQTVDLTTVFPVAFRLKVAWRYKFYIPGILFILFMVGKVPSRHDLGALNGSAGNYMWLCSWQNDSLHKGFTELIIKSKPTGRVKNRSRE